jgi:hypothetical protein
MVRIIGDRKEKSALDEMEEVARARNRDVAEEERLDALRKARGEDKEKPSPAGIPAKEEPEPLAAEVPLGPAIPCVPPPPNFIYMKKARDIADTIENEIGFVRRPAHSMGYRLYKYGQNSTESDTCYTADNAAMAMLHKLTGKKDEYSETIEGIKKCIDRKPSFWRSKPTYYNFSDNPLKNKEYSLEANAMMAILAGANNNEEAALLVRIAEKKSRQDGWLLSGRCGIDTAANVLMALAYSRIGNVDCSTSMRHHIKEKVMCRIKGGYSANNASHTASVQANAAMAMLEVYFGEKKEAEDLIDLIETSPSLFPRASLFKNSAMDDTSPVYTNALLGCAYAMLGGARINE